MRYLQIQKFSCVDCNTDSIISHTDSITLQCYVRSNRYKYIYGLRNLSKNQKPFSLLENTMLEDKTICRSSCTNIYITSVKMFYSVSTTT